MRDINFLEYTLPACRGEEVDDEWLESLQIINDDLHWLLSQSHWLFWSQVFSAACDFNRTFCASVLSGCL